MSVDCSFRQRGDDRGGRDEREGEGELEETESAAMFIPPCRDVNTN